MLEEFPSELRLDPISKDWIIIAKGRAKRPETFKLKKTPSLISEKECPFCNLTKSGNEIAFLAFLNGKKFDPKGKVPKKWTTIVIPNKYPALSPSNSLKEEKVGKFYKRMLGIGYCELVITKDHFKHFPDLKTKEIKEIFDAYQARYLELMKKPFVNNISIFHNYGSEAGATQPHPHSQIITTPLIDVDFQRTIESARDFFKKTKKCIYCEIQKEELKAKERIIFETKRFLALCPFASKTAFEVIISPKFHSPNFERISEKDKFELAEIFGKVMKKISKALDNPPYNFYLHTAPSDGKDYRFYHWHFTIFPKTATLAGFELGTRMEICLIEPERAAKILREI